MPKTEKKQVDCWDIELAFRALKDFLGGKLLWSARWEVIGCQLLAGVLVANVFHVAHAAEVLVSPRFALERPARYAHKQTI